MAGTEGVVCQRRKRNWKSGGNGYESVNELPYAAAFRQWEEVRHVRGQANGVIGLIRITVWYQWWHKKEHLQYLWF